jgi:hypothetical protein
MNNRDARGRKCKNARMCIHIGDEEYDVSYRVSQVHMKKVAWTLWGLWMEEQESDVCGE